MTPAAVRRDRIAQHLVEKGPAPSRDIAKALDLSKPQVDAALKHMRFEIPARALNDQRRTAPTGGRPEIVWRAP